MKKISSVTKWLHSKKRSNVIGAGVFMLAFAAIGTVLLIRSLAAPQSIFLTPATGSAQVGTDYTVNLHIDPGTPINAVDATISYDATKLQFKSSDVTAAGLQNFKVDTTVSGKIQFISGSTSGNVQGDISLGTVTFTVLGTQASTTLLSVTGQAADANSNPVTLSFVSATLNITAPPSTPTAAYTIESTVASPNIGSAFGLKVFANSTTTYQGGEVIVNLPAGLSYVAPLDTTGTAFNPATTVTGTTAQSVHLVFVTQSTTLTGKQLVATIPVTSSTAGAKSITMTGARLADANSQDITPVTANAVTVTINAASLPAPTVSIPGKAQIAATENITDLKQTFTIANFDSGATYTVTLGGQAMTLSGANFSTPSSIKNGDLALVVSASKSGATGSSTFTIRLRSPNVNRIACVELLDLLAVNKEYGHATAEMDLNFDNTVSLFDLLTVTGAWGGACV